MANPYAKDLERNPANFAPLTPLNFIARAADVHPERIAVIHGDTQFTWAETYARCRRLASALAGRGIGAGDTVSVIAPNVPAIYEAHFGVPMTGAVLNTINSRLDGATIAFILDHSESRLLIADKELSPSVKEALAKLDRDITVIDIDDPQAEGGELLGEKDYEAFLAEGDPEFAWKQPDDEWDPISLCYTSGTTGNPKGVVSSHRGATLNAMGETMVWVMGDHPVYLWTLPMFHANGWCFPWAIAAMAGTNVCLRKVEAPRIYDAIARHRVTHMCAAPIVLSMIINASDNEKRPFDHRVDIMTAAAPPPPSVLAAIEAQGFRVTHVYGLTEVYGPATVCAWKEEWNDLPPEEQALKKARQGVRYPVLEGLMVADPETLEPVPKDGATMGEVFMRGNNVMKGYLKNKKATEEAFAGGWFHTGDLGVWHDDGYIELKDRSKDIIISGGENISTIEVENTIYKHPAVAEAAVVARPDEKWGETPCAFVALKPGETASERDIVDFCRDNLPHYMCPKTVVFTELPKTSTGKIQKFKLRDQAKAL